MSKIPKFKSEEEEAKFWDTHDLTNYLDEFEEVNEEIIITAKKRTKKLISIRMDEDIIVALKLAADKKRMPYQTLIQSWLVEKLNAENPTYLS
jgi:predicted DNA binding CopG/RHH family protein